MNVRLYAHDCDTGALDQISPRSALVFPGGEPHVELPTMDVRGQSVVIDARIGCAADLLMALAMTDAARRAGALALTLFAPYFPGARQDRCEPDSGNAITAKVYADIVNGQRYDRVIVVDPHSDVTPALLDRCEVLTAGDVLVSMVDLPHLDGIICPDAGAEKRATAAAKALGDLPVVCGRKRRDRATGQLAGFSLDPLPTSGHFLIVDDICDGGGTFVGLADEFYRDPAAPSSTLSLYVTHGIFSRGLDVFSEHFARIYTTDSFPTAAPSSPTPVTVHPLLPLLEESL